MICAFSFSAAVDHDSVEAQMRNGMLRLKVTKLPHEQKEHKEVNVNVESLPQTAVPL